MNLPIETGLPSSRAPSLRFAVGGVIALCLSLGLSFIYYDRSWTPADDGHYIHVADRLLTGDVLNRDVEEFHPGYVHLVNVLALEAFGSDIVSLRIPLVAMAVLQSLIAFAWFASRGVVSALLAAMTMAGLGVLQIATPLTGLYPLFLTVLIIAVLKWLPSGHNGRLIMVGFLLSTMFLFRQLSAVFVAMGVLTYLLIEHRRGKDRPGVAARLLLVIMAAGLTTYLLTSTDAGGIVLIGVWPLGIIIGSWNRVTIRNAEVGRILLLLAVGAMVSLVPIVGYHLFHGSLDDWGRDVFVRSLSVTGLDHIEGSRYYAFAFVGFLNIMVGESLAAHVNGVYWAILPMLTVMNGLAVWRMMSGRLSVPEGGSLLPVVTVFYALVSVFNQIPQYLYLSAGLSLCCFLWWSPYRWKNSPVPGAIAAILLVIGIVYHAGQPYTRGFEGMVEGKRIELVESGLERASIWMDPEEAARYRDLVSLIREETAPGESIFVVPNDAAVYFLSDRPNPFRIFNPTLSLLDTTEVDAFLEEYRRRSPKLLIHNTDSPYNTDLTRKLLEGATRGYTLVRAIGEFRIFLRTTS